MLIGGLIGMVSVILFDMTKTLLDLSDQFIKIENLWEKIENGPKTPNVFSGPKFKYVGGNIVFNAVELTYISGSPVLKDFSYTFESGKRYALIGAS